MVGKIIRDLRLALGRTQESFGSIIDVDRTTIAKYEGDEVTPSFIVIERIITTFKMNPQKFFSSFSH